MVAPSRYTPPDAADFAPCEDTPSRYATTIDQNCARYDPGAHSFQVFDLHESFKPATRNRRLTKAQCREIAVKQAALRIAAGLESRSLRALARAIGCHHNTIDKALRLICERIGLRKYHVSDSTREKLRRARAKQIDTESRATAH